MGLAGFKGKVYHVPVTTRPLGPGGWATPSGSDLDLSDEMTKFTINDRVNMKKYGHDKSLGCQDTCSGTKGYDITIEAKIANANFSGITGDDYMWAGKILWLKCYPVGVAPGIGTPLPATGYAEVENVSYTYDQETGEPIGYTATAASKGPWANCGAGSGNWGGFQFS
jgi:hypothetical protein